MDELICVGAIAGAFGVKGEVRLKSFTAEPRDIADYAPLTHADGTGAYQITLTREIKNGFAARISGVTSKEAADSLKGTQLYCPRERLPGLPDDEFYHADLIGLDARDTGGQTLGRIHAVHNHGASDLLELAIPGHSRTVLVPFTRAIVPTVDLTARRVIIDPPDGLLDDTRSTDS